MTWSWNWLSALAAVGFAVDLLCVLAFRRLSSILIYRINRRARASGLPDRTVESLMPAVRDKVRYTPNPFQFGLVVWACALGLSALVRGLWLGGVVPAILTTAAAAFFANGLRRLFRYSEYISSH